MNDDRYTHLQKARESTQTIEMALSEALSQLKAPRKAAVEKRALEMPERSVRTYLKSIQGKSPKAAFKAMCMECVGWSRQEVTACTALACPIWGYRPFQPKA